ncbi:MAG: hypothetical protein H6505_02490 [Calditrichaeota bacterium]|nr:hypothetical protein [Calditrichota bacterium]
MNARFFAAALIGSLFLATAALAGEPYDFDKSNTTPNNDSQKQLTPSERRHLRQSFRHERMAREHGRKFKYHKQMAQMQRQEFRKERFENCPPDGPRNLRDGQGPHGQMFGPQPGPAPMMGMRPEGGPPPMFGMGPQAGPPPMMDRFGPEGQGPMMDGTGPHGPGPMMQQMGPNDQPLERPAPPPGARFRGNPRKAL